MSAMAKAWVCGPSIAGITVSNSAKGHGCLYLVSVVRYTSLSRGDHLSRGVPPSVVCLSVIVKPQQ
jgi:hypothetical protein